MSHKNITSQFIDFKEFSAAIGFSRYRAGNTTALDEDDDSYEVSGPVISRASRLYNNAIDTRTSQHPAALWYPRISIDIFIDLLRQSNLAGPVAVETGKTKIGEGGQFIVYKQKTTVSGQEFDDAEVATKRLKLPGPADTALALSDMRAQRHLYHAFLEIRTLTHQKLRDHPNIVRLLAWALDDTDWRKYPVLCFELATTDLFSFLQKEKMLSQLAKDLSYDIATGLDAIHDCGLSHGDLKPANILLFTQGPKTVAKISDFGFSHENDADFVVGGTAGWQAPEVRSNLSRDIDTQLADSYSYGLILWSISFLRGLSPQSGFEEMTEYSIKVLLEGHASNSDIGGSYCKQLQSSVLRLLKSSPSDRPKQLQTIPLFCSLGVPGNDNTVGIDTSSDELDGSSDLFHLPSYLFSWEVDPVPQDLLSVVLEQVESHSSDQKPILDSVLFPTFLLCTAQRHPETAYKQNALRILGFCAEQGFPPAQNLMAISYNNYGLEVPRRLHSKLVNYFQAAVRTGSIQARKELSLTDTTALRKSLDFFRKSGGYLLHYADIEELYAPSSKEFKEKTEMCGNKHYGEIHWVCARGTTEALNSLLCESTESVERYTIWGDTPLHLACMRGDSDILKKLISHGADPNATSRWSGTSCLHWLFNFDEDEQDNVAKTLLDAGARVDEISQEVPFSHYPFVLPAGTPLHWSIALGCHKTTSVLLENGADPLIRNGADPYAFDKRVRVARWRGGDTYDRPATPEKPCQGLSPLDLAARYRDCFLFEWLVREKPHVKMDAADEMGFTVIHHLATDPVWRTRWNAPFDSRVFRQQVDKDNIPRLLRLMVKLGSDLEALTDLCHRGRLDYTPLMLAADVCDLELVESLLGCGVLVDQKNTNGDTALLLVAYSAPQEESSYLSCLKVLIQHGADINHRDYEGCSALWNACFYQFPVAVDFLLAKGADITQRRTVGHHRDVNPLVLLTQGFDNEVLVPNGYDASVARILETRLFSQEKHICIDVVHRGDQQGRTLLHAYAEAALMCCVQTLIQHGADVNAKRTKYLVKGWVKGRECRIIKYWQLTPLDDVLARLKYHQTISLKENQYHPTDLEMIIDRHEKVVQFLRQHGAVEANSEIREGIFEEKVWPPSWQ